MFERLAGKLLSRLLSKYFRSSSNDESAHHNNQTGSTTSSSSSNNNSGAVSTQLSVWSGYVTLENLELRRELVNEWLAREGMGFELVQCTLRRVELTVPWSKLTSLSQQQPSSLDDPDAVVVVVLDGVHILLRTNLQWDDAAMRKDSIRKRRQALSEVVDDLKGKASASAESTFVSFLKRRLSQWHGIAKKLQVHIRDVHIRWEDVESDSSNPFAFGVTMESMHIQHDTDDNGEGDDEATAQVPHEAQVIRKVFQLNHLAVYWNALNYDPIDGAITEFSVLHRAHLSSFNLQKVLDRSIARRATLSSTLFQSPSLFPKHSYLLLPVDATMHGVFTGSSSTNVTNSSSNQILSTTLQPAFSGILEIDLVSIQLRDYQYSGVLTCAAAFREHAHVKHYRKYYRPSVGVMEDPRAWWYYAWQVIRYELKSHMRWSWKRFYQRFAQRQRYCELYERFLRSTTTTYLNSPTASSSNRPSRQNSRASELDSMADNMATSVASSDPTTALATATPDDGAGPSNSVTEPSNLTIPINYITTISENAEILIPPTSHVMTEEERQELQDMEDGLRGELSLDDIILYRALVTSRLHPVSRQDVDSNVPKTRSSWWRGAIQNEVLDDREATEELNRLMAYVEHASDNQQDLKEKNPLRRNQVVFSLDVRLGQGCVALFSPLKSTADLEPRRRLQERFFELSIVSLETQFSLMGDYSTFRFHAALANLLASEIRSSRKHFTVIARSSSPSLSIVEIEETLKAGALFDVEIATNSQARDNCDLLFLGHAELLHVFLAPDCEWVERIVQLAKHVPSVPKVENFWEDISMAMVNSWGRGLIHLRKKATAVIFTHKKVELKILVRCPVIHVGGSNEEESSLVIDLGTAHFTTEKLGGSAVTKTSSKRKINGSIDLTSTSFDVSPKRKLYQMPSAESPIPDRFDLRSTSMSVGEGFTPFLSSRSVFGNANYGESVQFGGEDFPDIEYDNPVNIEESRDLQSCFYDTYQLRVRTEAGTVLWADHNEGNECLVESIDVRVFIKKSILPADHTLCRLKCSCLVDSLRIGVSPSDILRLVRMFKVWKDAFGQHENWVSSPVSQPTHQEGIKRRLLPLSKLLAKSIEEDASDSSSKLDENEFFDAVESEAESGTWFDEMIVDSDTVFDTGSKAILRARRRPRLPSVSDVSSSSDQTSSQKPQGRKGVTYLSAENLAKLDERAAEEDSATRDSKESAADTFHSALSLARQAELAADLERSIQEVETSMEELNEKLAKASKMRANSSSDAKQRRLFRRHMLLELEKSAAELRALRLAQEDLKKDMIISQDYLLRQKAGLGVGDFAGGDIISIPPSAIMESVGWARALVMDRSRRRASVDVEGFHHTLTRNLNRELFTGSITFGSIALELRDVEKYGDKDELSDALAVTITDCTIAIVYRAKDVKVSGSVDHLAMKWQTDESQQSTHYLVIGGGCFPLAPLLLPSQYPQHLSSTTMGERLCRISLEIQRLSLNRRSARVRVAIGDLEFQPHAELLRKIVKCFHSLSKEVVSAHNVEKRSDSSDGMAKQFERGFLPFACFEQALLDVYVRLTSLRVRLTDDERTVGAIALTEMGVRLVQDASDRLYSGRGHLELRLGNIQLLDIDASESFTCLELFGKKDAYDSLVRTCMRWQLVPQPEQSGWVVDRAFDKGVTDASNGKASVWNVHCGSKVQSIGMLAYSGATSRQIAAVTTILDAIKVAKSVPIPHDVNRNRFHRSFEASPRPIRWRCDFLVGKLSIDFPCAERPKPFIDEANSLSLLISLTVCLQLAKGPQKSLLLTIAATRLSVLRSHDEWPLLDNVATICEAKMAIDRGGAHEVELTPLRLPSDSPWNVMSAVLHRYRWDDISTRHETGTRLSVAVALASVHVNISPQICAQLLAAAHLFAQPLAANKSSTDERKGRNEVGDEEFSFYLSHTLESAELRLFRELERKAAKIVVLIEAHDGFFSMRKREGVVEIEIRLANASVFDLSFSPGVRILGKQIDEESQSEIRSIQSTSSDNNAAFVLARLRFDSSSTRGKPIITLGADFGHIHCVILPSFFESLLTFASQLSQQTQHDSSTKDPSSRKQLDLPFGSERVTIVVGTSSMECVVSSRDIQAHVNEKGAEAISVVKVRWNSEVKTELFVSDRAKYHPTVEMDDVISETFGFDNLDWPDSTQETTNKQINARRAFLKLGVDLNRFLVARTTISKQKGRERTIGNFHAAPYLFLSSSPSTGEQRITNSIDCKFTYRAVCTSSKAVRDTGSVVGGTPSLEQYEIALSQALTVEARLVDVLVYINQSQGGINDALRVTIKPIVAMMKREDSRKSTAEKLDSTSYVDEVLRNATTVWSVQAEGFQITCVPGGATRLTESPIIKCALSKFEAGGGLLAAPRELKWLLGSAIPSTVGQLSIRDLQPSFLDISSADPILTRFTVLHLVSGAWLSAELSASYHNRRLVAWEPFVEPWILSARVGGDLTQLMSLNPLESLDKGLLDASSSPERPSAFPAAVPSDSANERMRDLGRFLRSPFKQDAASRKNSQQDDQHSMLSQADLCYHLLATSSRAVVTPAIYSPSFVAKRRPNQVDVAVPPGNRPQDWLQRFGYPEAPGSYHPSLIFSLSDSMPLNVNLTGALLENLLAYLKGGNDIGQRPAAPHRIRNDTGMTIRFQEVLDTTRLRKGEKSSKKILSNGSEIPLSLKRSLSQSCDPHRGYIWLELGSFEDTAGRLNHDEFERPEGSLYTAFYFKVVTKIPVDTVGVHKYPLCRNLKRRACFVDKEIDSRGTLGYVIVRVALQGGVKLVSIESPVVLKNVTDVDIICELRSHEGLSLLWRRWIPKLTRPVHDSTSRNGLVSIPVDLVSSIQDDMNSFSMLALPRNCAINDDAARESCVKNQGCRIDTPPPYSQFSVNRGVLKIEHIRLDAIARESGQRIPSFVHVEVCSVRIGTFSFALSSLKSSPNAGVTPAVEIPEQRMVLFQTPFVVRSHLPTPVQVEVRSKTAKPYLLEADNKGTVLSDWEMLETVECGQAVCWTGASPQDKVEVRCRLLDDDGNFSELFPNWSSVAMIPSVRDLRKSSTRAGNSKPSALVTLKLCDCFGHALSISLSVAGGRYLGNNDVDDINLFAQSLPLGSREVSMYVPFWVVDSTNQDLEFFAGTVVAGQQSNQSCGTLSGNSNNDDCLSNGLAELYNDDSLSGIARPPFEVLMIGDEKASRLIMRRRMVRGTKKTELVSPWSNPVILRTTANAFQDVSVPPPAHFEYNVQNDQTQPYALRSRILPAPLRFGGALGTKILHIVNRFEIVNETGRDIEILVDGIKGVSVIYKAERLLRPFHFDDLGPIRFRPKELGWIWSGKFEISRKRKELTLRLRHKLRNETIIANIEFFSPKSPPVTYIVFRNASHPPFRIENHTMYPLNVSQLSAFWSLDTGRLWNNEQTSTGAILLPYQNMDFAWDQPEGKNSVMIEVANLEQSLEKQNPDERQILGCYDLERIAPGTKLRVQHEGFAGHVFADGPTRIVRLTDSTSPVIPSGSRDILKTSGGSSSKIFEVRLVHGIGVSVVDWVPQELLYIRLEDVLIKRRIDEGLEHVNFSVASITIDNQLWLTPYPVMMHVGRLQTEKRRQYRATGNAVAISWCLRLNANGANGNLTLFERVDVVTEPVFLNVDAQLVDLIAVMLYRVVDAGANNGSIETLASRNAELRKVLGISDLSKKRRGSQSSMPQQDSSSDFVILGCTSDSVTAVSAIKQKFHMQSASVGIEPAIKNRTIPDVEWVDSLLRPRQKIYLERFRIATTKSEISWSGPLPGALMSFPRFMRPALTFEGLPLLIRPYSSSHKYGTLEDHLEELKSHYLSIWRIVDLLVGLTFNPTFMIRAWIYTFRERVAVTFDSLSKALSDANTDLMHVTPKLDDGTGMLPEASKLKSTSQFGSRFFWFLVEPFLSLSSSLLSGSSKAAATGASLFRYGPKANLGGNRVPRGVVRSRNPRLFATADGNDLLVDYVEGENAGRELLSRVRMGAHSAEGYLYHSECTTESHSQRIEALDNICMVTSERILLLNGIRDINFCSVNWEMKFENLVHLEVLTFDDVAMFDQVKLWFLSGADTAFGSNNDLIGQYAQVVVGSLDGLDLLICKEIFVPRKTGRALRDKINSIQNNLVDNSG